MDETRGLRGAGSGVSFVAKGCGRITIVVMSTIVALLNAGRLDHAALTSRLHGMDYEPALIVECWQVMEEITTRVAV